jgi:hypothetical protein
MGAPEYQIPNDPNIDPVDIRRGADLSEGDLFSADLSEADLFSADLSEATLSNSDLSGAILYSANLSKTDLFEADLSGADLSKTDLSEADLFGADLSGADLSNANLSEADPHGANLSGADLRGADLSKADLDGADLSGADLRSAKLNGTYLAGVTLSGVSLSRATEINGYRDRIISQDTEGSSQNSSIIPKHTPKLYDTIARVNHELRKAFSENGLTDRARTARIRERKARRREAFVEGGLKGTTDWIWSCALHGTTRYGIQLNWIVAYILLLFTFSAAVYFTFHDLSLMQSLYYSTVTLTTTWPGDTLPTGFVAFVAAFETFAGTAAIVFLGYVLGTRERV